MFNAQGVLSQPVSPSSPDHAPTPATGQYSDLLAQSAALTPDKQLAARQVFATAFGLWQSGNFDAAALGFEKGLTIDPANAPANYYLGDCLEHEKHRKDAIEYFNRAAVLGAGSAEGLKAAAARDKLTSEFSTDEMSQDEIKALYVGTWTSISGPSWTIYRGSNGDLKIKGIAGCFLIICNGFKNLQFDGQTIRFFMSDYLWGPYHLTSATTMNEANGTLGATKKVEIKKQ
jgi:hypothetical protein